MKKKLTILVEKDIYDGLHQNIGRGNIGSFLERLAKPYIVSKNIKDAYREMASDEDREKDAMQWAEGLVGDINA